MRTYTDEELSEIYRLHFDQFLCCGDDRWIADLSYKNLSRRDLSSSNFACANISHSNFKGVNLSWANLNKANLNYSDFSNSNLAGINLEYTDLFNVNFSYCNFSHAHLTGTDFTMCNLEGCLGNDRQIKNLKLDTYPIAYTKNRLQIGSKNFGIDRWFGFDDKFLNKIGEGFLDWWKTNKGLIKESIEDSPAILVTYDEYSD